MRLLLRGEVTTDYSPPKLTVPSGGRLKILFAEIEMETCLVNASRIVGISEVDGT